MFGALIKNNRIVLISIDGQSFLDEGITCFINNSHNRRHSSANKFINEGLDAFHSEEAKKIITEQKTEGINKIWDRSIKINL